MNKKTQVVSSMVERLVYTEAVESSNPSLPIEKRKPSVWVAQVVEYQVEGLIVGSSSLPPDRGRGKKVFKEIREEKAKTKNGIEKTCSEKCTE
jgi:hypothetical protein